MASCSSTTTLLHKNENDVRRVRFPSCFLRRSSLADLRSAVCNDVSVLRWQELPLTERLEIAESLLTDQYSKSTEERIFNVLAVLALFASPDGDHLDILRLQHEALTILEALSPTAAPVRSDIGEWRKSLTRQPYTRWGPSAIVVGIGVMCLLIGARLSSTGP